MVRSDASRRVRAVAIREARGGGGFRGGIMERSQGMEGTGRDWIRRVDWIWVGRSAIFSLLFFFLLSYFWSVSGVAVGTLSPKCLRDLVEMGCVIGSLNNSSTFRQDTG